MDSARTISSSKPGRSTYGSISPSLLETCTSDEVTPLALQESMLPPVSENFFRSRWKSYDQVTPVKDKVNKYLVTYDDWDLDEAVAEFRNERHDEYNNIIRKLDKWFTKHKGRLLYVFINMFGKKEVSFNDFKRCLRDCEFPATNFELHMTCLLFDSHRRKAINLKNLEVNVLARQLKQEHTEKLELNKIVDIYDRYVRLKLICEMLADVPRFKGHLNLVVKTKLHIYSLIDIIQNLVGLQSRSFAFYLFSDHAMKNQCELPLEATLEDLGIPGGRKLDPPMFTLYYNYLPNRQLCPLIHYVPYNTKKRVLKSVALLPGKKTIKMKKIVIDE